jgi:LemA protein
MIDYRLWIALATGLFGLMLIILIFNRLIQRNNMVKEAWSNIDVQLKRRHVLIPNLLETVKSYIEYEKSVFVDVTTARNKCVQLELTGPSIEFLSLENALSTHLQRFWGLVENYPDIKANQTFLDFQRQLSDTEDKIQLARRYYNGSVRDFNIVVESFPSNIIAKMFKFKTKAFFQIENPMEKLAPTVKFE